MKNVMIALLATMLAGALAPVASASTVSVDVDNPAVECETNDPLSDVWKAFDGLRVDAEDCDASASADLGVEAECASVGLGRAFRHSVSVSSGCDVTVR